MDCQLPSTSALPWVWVLEILARSKQVDVSLLLDLVKKVPETSDGIFGNVKELVSLRILETIYIQEAARETSVSSDSSKKFGIDPSECCDDVLKRIIKETSNLKAAGVEMSKWDIQPFLEHKRSSFPKCFLEKVKDAILTGNHPPLVSLRERSGLPVGKNQPEPQAPVDGGDCNGITTSPSRNDSSTQVCSEKGQLISPVPANSKSPLHENLPAKSKISAPIEIVEERPCKDMIMWEDNLEAIMKSVKKYKPDTISSEKQIPHGITEAPLDKSDEESSQDNVAAKENGEREDFSEVQRTYKDEELGQDCDIDDAECDDQGPRERERTANVNMDELDQNIQSNVPNEAKKGEGIDSDRHNDEMADIAKKKEAFLSSQCTFSQDSLTDDWSELKLCVKCSKGENVLVCCSSSCPMVVHESCLGAGAGFDKDGKFYCPFCAYSRAVSEYQEAKKKASAARNGLTAFIFTESRKGTEKQPPELHRTSQNHSKQVDKNYDLKSKAICRGKLDCEKAGPSKFSSGDGPPNKGKEVGLTDGTPHTKSKHEQERRKRTMQVSHSPRIVRRRQTNEQAILKTQDEQALHEVSERIDELAEVRSKKGVSGPTETDLHCEHKSSSSAESADEEEISEDGSDNPGASEYYVRVRKPEKQCPFRVQKKGRLFWTSAEEKKLKEAIEVICDEECVTIPWKKILEYGAGTFHEDRTAAQLKDKWRNICKANKE